MTERCEARQEIFQKMIPEMSLEHNKGNKYAL